MVQGGGGGGGGGGRTLTLLIGLKSGKFENDVQTGQQFTTAKLFRLIITMAAANI